MELGNIVFGNSRGEHPVDRDLQDEFHEWLGKLGFDSHGNKDGSEDWVFENDTFRVQPYYWGDCTCGFDERDWQWSRDNRHGDDCYQSELRREKIAAGGTPHGEWGGIERPACLSYDQWDTIERAIFKKLCAKHGLDPVYGCAVHCTCSHDSDYQAWRIENDHAPGCPIVTPNFLHKPSGFRLDWYKYPLRDSYSSAPLTLGLMRSMFRDCAVSLGVEP